MNYDERCELCGKKAESDKGGWMPFSVTPVPCMFRILE